MGKKSRRAGPCRNKRNDRVTGVTPIERRATKVDRYPALNGLRGLAALAVFGVHACAVAGLPVVLPSWPAAGFAIHWLLRMGWAGVDVFFTLSAFLLALPHARAFVNDAAPPSLPGYAARRAPMEGNPHPQWLMIGWHGYASIAVAGMLIACVRWPHIVGKLLDSLPLQLLGRISYGVYLWHLPVLLWMNTHGGVAALDDGWAFIVSALLFTLTAGWLSWWIIERPALRFAARWPHDARARMRPPVSVHMP